MAARNLSQTAAQERARLIRVSSYEVLLDVTDGAAGPGTGTFRSTTTVRFDCTEPGVTAVIDLAAEKVIEVRLNGVTLGSEGWSAESGLPVAGLAETNVLTVAADFAYVTDGKGMHRSVDPADGEVYLYTSFEPAAAQRVFGCFDQPDLKATFTWHVRIPPTWRAVSNMPATGSDSDETGALTVHFAPSPRMSTYITAVCAGPYAEVRTTDAGRDLGIYCRPSLLAHLDAEEVFDLTRRGMDFYERHFGQPYPLPKYDHVAVPEYLGAMENFGCIVFSERHLIFRSAPTEVDRLRRGMIILHELAHMWFGDLVTMRWWDDLWLNEAFATWASYWCLAEATDLPEPWANFTVENKTAAIKADQLSSTHPVRADIPDVDATEINFDAITYQKGASVLKHLAAYVGIDSFTAGLRRYFGERAWGNATFDDLADALADASGRPVRDFAAQWLRTAQVNTLRPQITLDAEGRYESVAVLQEAPAHHPTLRTHRMGVGLYDRSGGGLERRDLIELEIAGERTQVLQLRGVRAPDVLLLNDNDVTYAKIRLDDRSLATVLAGIQDFRHALPRAMCWRIAADMVSDAEMAARDFVTMACSALAAEPDAGLVTSVVAEATRALNLFTDPAWAPTGRSMLTETCRSAAYAAVPGSPMQLTWARAFASAARTPEHLASMHAWYQGADLPDGLRLEQDLRWAILHGLVAFGAAGVTEVEREAAADRSVNGQREAAIARALVPTTEAKLRAWQTATDGAVEQSLELRVATLTGYGYAAHTHLTESHVALYLSTLDDIWRRLGHQAGRLFALVAFPQAHVSAETVAAADAWCAADGHPPGLVRLVRDGRDQMVRALAGRARDASQAG